MWIILNQKWYKSLGFKWGGDWKKPDRPHFEYNFGKHHTQLAQMYASGKLKEGYLMLG
ncbi:M15 family metallopeptidase [Aquimarina pacifica]|uniref:M15 family metallopeptidase n=1 Tax=Aquimarina pacifica TaxID=1296415 RepID=UPI001267DC28